MRGASLLRSILSLLAASFIILSASSCSTLDEYIDEAQDVAKDVAGAVTDAVDDLQDDGGNDSSAPATHTGPARPTGSISTGPSSIVASGVVEPSGGIVTVHKPGDPLNGLELTVPPGSYPNVHQVSISQAPVAGHTFGGHFTPATPVIIIENGGQYSEKLMTLRIPVDVPRDHFAMAFYYDDVTGALEGIPLTAVEADSVTIVTRHFSKLLVSIIGNTVLDDLLKKGIDSGFRPGADDWQFTNYGSFVASGGHCAGQSLTALWYYCEQPDGADPFLWGLYDNNGREPATPDLEGDDSYGYRFASSVHQDINWISFENEFMYELRGASDELALRAFAYGMLLTGEPQEVGIYSSAGGGHDMIVYRVDAKGLSIADPNYPGNTDRRIEYANGKFAPYNSGANAAEIAAGHGHAYETIQYCAKTATVDWNKIAQRWNEFKAGTIGNDRFPPYDVVLVDDQGQETPLADGYESPHKKVRVKVKAGVPIALRVYRNGVRIEPDAQRKYELEDGDNLLGIEIFGDVNNDPQNREFSYIDFQYFNVRYGEQDCYGWVLESVTPTVERYSGGDERFYQDFTLDVSEGSYTSEGRIIIPMLEEDSVAHFRHTGTWSPLPACIGPDETVTLTLGATSALEIIPPVDWGTVYNSLIVSLDVPQAELGRINLEARFEAVPGMASQKVEVTLGEGFEGLQHEVIVQFSTETGRGEYRYKYVWRG